MATWYEVNNWSPYKIKTLEVERVTDKTIFLAQKNYRGKQRMMRRDEWQFDSASAAVAFAREKLTDRVTMLKDQLAKAEAALKELP